MLPNLTQGLDELEREVTLRGSVAKKIKQQTKKALRGAVKDSIAQIANEINSRSFKRRFVLAIRVLFARVQGD